MNGNITIDKLTINEKLHLRSNLGQETAKGVKSAYKTSPKDRIHDNSNFNQKRKGGSLLKTKRGKRNIVVGKLLLLFKVETANYVQVKKKSNN